MMLSTTAFVSGIWILFNQSSEIFQKFLKCGSYEEFLLKNVLAIQPLNLVKLKPRSPE